MNSITTPYIVTGSNPYICSCSRYLMQQVMFAATYVRMVMCENVGSC